MPKKIWDMGAGRPVGSSPGLRTNGDYSGLYKQKNATAGPIDVAARGAHAQEHARLSARKLLNEGEPFVGFLAERRVDHVTLHIGRHVRHGLSAYPDRPTSHADGKIEIITSAGKKIVTSRNDFFGLLSEAEIPESQIEAFCVANWQA